MYGVHLFGIECDTVDWMVYQEYYLRVYLRDYLCWMDGMDNGPLGMFLNTEYNHPSIHPLFISVSSLPTYLSSR